MTTVNTVNLTEYSDSNDRRVWALDSHTANEPRLVIQKRRITGPSDAQKSTMELSVVYGTSDAAGDPLQSKVNLTLTASYPNNGDTADLQAAVDTMQALIASTEIDNSVEKLLYLA